MTLQYLRENHLPKPGQYNLVDVKPHCGSKRCNLVGVDHPEDHPERV